ncbi:MULTISPECIES: tRNA threonylcarbamoyladenosine dehydratase [Anaerostipes]|uniref:tRNA threonylcarbamoyladenosine dehydratase n=1 Tax=Anaerostipes TaxID=207244 RepID=UPI0019155914|nr:MULTISPECIES: tRNA threonylcarbamoyladenosine dehydratase [Anaerostipes]HJC83575.1 tRNA threonylcarbamoyladenosine dehydratase [Candidatus Anaerostipes avicola]
MKEQFMRTGLLLGEEGIRKLNKAAVAVFGIGGVGGFTVEALARSGIGHLVLVDADEVSESNINRQIIATHQTVGRPKVEVMKERIAQINPETVVETYQTFFLPENADQFDFASYDYVVDAIDTVTGKIELVLQGQKAGTPVISSMGAGNKLDPTMFQVADIYDTSVCPLAKVMRKELKKRNVPALKVVYSKEKAMEPAVRISEDGKRQIPGSTAFVPSVAGLIIAGEVIKDLSGISEK